MFMYVNKLNFIVILLFTSLTTATIFKTPQEYPTIQVRVLYSHPDEHIHPFRQNDLINGKPFNRFELQPPIKDEFLNLEVEHKQNFEQNRSLLHKSSLFKVNDSGSLWKYSQKLVYTYDTNGNLTEKIRLRWKNDDWSNSRKDIFSAYDANKNLMERLWQIWDRDQDNWVNRQKKIYTYDINGNMRLFLFQEWDVENNVWENIWLITYTYDTNENRIEDLFQLWDKDNNSWVNREREIYTYNTYGNMTEQLRQMFENNIWVSWWKIFFTYDSNGNITEELHQTWPWNINAWVNSHRYTSTYNANRNLLEWLGQYWDDENNGWRTPYVVHTYTYDINENKTEELWQIWDRDQDNWVNDWKETYKHDENGNLSERLSKDWYNEKNVWVNISKTNYIYSNNGNLLEELEKSFKYAFYVQILSNDISLSQNYPNPFNSLTTFHFSIRHSDFVSIKVYNVLGKEITILVNDIILPGNHVVIWNANEIPSGIYFIRMQSGSFSQVRKVTVLR